MGLPSLENGPYTFSVNNLFTSTGTTDKIQRFWLGLKNTLVGLGGAGTIWAVWASSNKTSVVNNNDGGDLDLWDSQSDVDFGTGDHSWIILENQTTGSQISIQLNYSSGTSGRVRFSPGGTYATTGGTVSALPASTDTQYLTLGTCFNPYTSNRTKFVISAATSADRKGLFIYTHEKDASSGETGGILMFVSLALNAPSLWTSTDKYVSLYAADQINIASTTYNKSPRAIDYDTLGGVRARVDTAEPASFWHSLWPTVECYGNLDGNAATPLYQYNTSCGFNGGFPICPIGLYNDGAGAYGGSWGRMRDIYFAQRLHDTFDTYPSDGSRQWIKLGAFLLPWNGDAPQEAE